MFFIFEIHFYWMWLLILAQSMVNFFNSNIRLFFFPHRISTKIWAKSWYTVACFHSKKKKCTYISTLTLDSVDILVYDFSLTKTGHLRQTTINILKEKLPHVAQDTTQIQTRSMSHNHVLVGLQLDEDNALVTSQ